GKTYLMEGARQLTLAMLDSGVSPSVATAIVKYHLTEMMREVINDAMDVHGGKGIMLGPTNYLMRIYQSIPISITVEGANILTRNMIIFGQGAMRCHPCLMDEIQAVGEEDPAHGLDDFDRTLGKHIIHIIGSCARSFLLALTGGYLSSRDKGERTLSRLSAALSFSVELVLILVGGQLKRRERISARLGDVLSYLYLGSGAIAQFNNNGRPAEEKLLYEWALAYSAYKAQEALWSLSQNLPLWASMVMRVVCFPFGRRYRLPLDKSDHKLAAMVLKAGPIRDRLVEGIYFPSEDDQALNQLMQAFDLAHASEAAKDKIHRAKRDGTLATENVDEALVAGVIDIAEAELIKNALEARMRVVQVDDFAPEEYA
ncbi:DUF1974 domain-containing protein, partial [Gammaproteobacteria bacterium]|nr:DUF1974 domain-containing protein [Gammaproteobacteria bacterium]